MRYFFFSLATLLLASSAFCAPQTRRQPYDPAFSADGSWIGYSEYVYAGNSVYPSSCELWVVRTNSTGLRRLTKGHEDHDPRWNRDGKQIAFERDGDIYTIAVDGTGLKNLTNSPKIIESKPEWTRDGSGLLFLRDEYAQIDGEWHPTGNKVILRTLATSKERVVVTNDFGIDQVVPALDRDDLAYVVCLKLDKSGKPIDDGKYENIVAALNLQSGQLRSVFALDPKLNRTLEKIRWAKDWFLVTTSDAKFDSDDVALLKGGKLTFLPQLSALVGDITTDGKTMVTPAILEINLESKWSLALYDADTKAQSQKIETCIADPNLIKAKDSFAAGNLLYDAKKYDEAIKAFSEAIELNPNYINAYYNRAYSNLMLEKPRDAITDYDNIIRLKSTEADAHMDRAEAYEGLGEIDKAIDDYTSAAIFGSNPQAYRKRAVLLRKQGLENMAVESENKAKELEDAAKKSKS